MFPGAPEDDCADPTDYNCDGSVAFIDDDADGYGACEDCDDGDPETNPGGVETCDGADQDCDGTADDDSVDAPAWYADLDADTFGDVTSFTFACTQPSGSVADSTDCDDDNAEISPSADESCDGADNDCDTEIDESGALGELTSYADLDNDGFGDIATPTSACDTPAGFVTDSTDCNDADPEISPAETERCDSEADENCDGETNPQNATGCTLYYEDADSDGYGEGSGACYCAGTETFDTPTDTDCDPSDAAVNPGMAELCDNGVDDDCDGGAGACGVQSMSLADADAVYVGESAGERAGGAVAFAGDVNGDGWDDLLIGRYAADTGVGAYVVFGSDAPSSTSLSSADAVFAMEAPEDYAGDSVAGAGDVNGDGFDDLLIGAPGNSDVANGSGAVYLVLGDVGFTSANLGSAAAQYSGAFSAAYVGYEVAGAGDVNGDHYDDVLISAYYNEDLTSSPVHLVLGSSAPESALLSEENIQYLEEATASSSIAHPAGVGDTNGDGLADVVIGVGDAGPGNYPGAAYLVLGTESPATMGLSSADAEWTGGADLDFAGGAVAGGGDVNADGYADVFVGATGAGVDTGEVYLLLGSPTPASKPLASADATFIGSVSATIGHNLANAGDVDADGLDDTLLGSFGQAGFLVYGTPTPTGTTNVTDGSTTVIADPNPSDPGLYAVAGGADANADGFDDLLLGNYSDDTTDSDAGAAYLILGGGL